jgi:hypothetical protein
MERRSTVPIHLANSCAVSQQGTHYRIMALDDSIHERSPTIAVTLVAVYISLLQQDVHYRLVTLLCSNMKAP